MQYFRTLLHFSSDQELLFCETSGQGSIDLGLKTFAAEARRRPGAGCIFGQGFDPHVNRSAMIVL